MFDFIFYHTPIFYLIQSVWRDEAFSYFMARPNPFQVVINTVSDFNPPLYYLLLHFWINIFGKSDEMLRLLSLIPHLLTVYIVYLFAIKLFSRRFAIFVAIFTLFNPMLLYYAFEMRMYSFYALFTLCSVYFFYLKNWKWYTTVSALGLYTHSFFPLIIVSFLVYLWKNSELKKKTIIYTLKPLLFYLPWFPVLIVQFLHSANSWMFPVDIQLITSAFGNLFTNYEGTPGNWWNYTAILSGFILLFLLLAFKNKRKEAYLFLTPIFIPLFLILGYSILRRPIYVNRYLIFITIFEIMGVSLGIWVIKNKILKYASIILWLIFIIYFNIKIVPYHKKADFKGTFMEINKLAKDGDLVFAKTPIAYLESAYYNRQMNKTFIYNPNNIAVPNYIGINVVFSNISKASFPPSPSRTFLVFDDASYEMIIQK